MLIGRPPAGQTYLDLKIQAMDDNNHAVTETVRIDLATGAVVSHAAEQHTDAGPLLFSAQTRLGIEAGAAQANSLAAALSLWSGLGDETRVA